MYRWNEFKNCSETEKRKKKRKQSSSESSSSSDSDEENEKNKEKVPEDPFVVSHAKHAVHVQHRNLDTNIFLSKQRKGIL